MKNHDMIIEILETMILMYRLIRKMNWMIGVLIISREEYEEMYDMVMKITERLRWMLNELGR